MRVGAALVECTRKTPLGVAELPTMSEQTLTANSLRTYFVDSVPSPAQAPRGNMRGLSDTILTRTYRS